VEIASDGNIQQDGNPVGQLALADFPNSAALVKQGSNYFRVADPALQPAAPSATSVLQGKLEASNTGPAEAAVRLVSVMRQFEMMQKAIAISNDMGREAIEQVAKI